MNKIKGHLLEKLCGSAGAVPIREDLLEMEECLGGVIRRLAEFGEPNSLLICGPQGSGKSFLVEKCLGEANLKEVLVVRLDGLLQTDDSIAMKEITRQLQLENVVKERVFGSMAETFQFLLQALKSGSQLSSRPVLVVIDRFDLFAHHSKQTLLYNLFDLSQTPSTPLTVIGMTRRLDVLDLLEKRVKSRFCHRQLHIANKWTKDDFVTAFVQLLQVPIKKYNAKKWNEHVKNLIKSETVIKILHKLHDVNREIPCLLQLAAPLIARLGPEKDDITCSEIADSFEKITGAEPKSQLLRDATIVELSLVVAIRHLMTNQTEKDVTGFNFRQIYNMFRTFADKSPLLCKTSQALVRQSFERLVKTEVLRPTSKIHPAKVNREFVSMSLMVSGLQVYKAVSQYPNCPHELKKWTDSAIV